MERKKEVANTDKVKSKKVTYTCVCNMEWRGTHDNEWGDCICYSDDEDKSDK